MASCQTSQWVSTAPYVKLTVTQSASTDTTATLTWTLQYIASSAASTSSARSYSVTINGSTVKSGTYSINGKTGTYTIASGTVSITKGTAAKTISFSTSFAFNLTWSGSYASTKSASSSISVAAKTSYKVTYNANSGSGAPSAQTKWYGTNLTLSSTKPSRTGYTFKGWGTSASTTTVSYAAGATYSANAAITLYAIWTRITYTVTYNANGGSSTPSAQTKYYGTNMTLASAISRTNYTFKGWGTSASATTAAYSAGATYSNNASITLYALWTLAYKKPTIKNISLYRCDSSGTAANDGTYAYISFNWTTFYTADSISVAVTGVDGVMAFSPGNTGYSGTASGIVASDLNTEKAYEVVITVADSAGTTTTKITLPGQTIVFDALKGGTGAAIGTVADETSRLKVGWTTRFLQHICNGEKTGYLDGKTGCFISNEGFMHIQRSSNNGYFPYIAFLIDDSTTVGAQIYYNPSNSYLTFTSASAYHFNSAIISNRYLGIGFSGYSTETGIITYWADGSTHWAVSRLSDGLTCTLGWVGSSSYASVTRIRARTVQYQNSSGTTALSDERMKTDFQHLDKWEGFFNQLEPVAFKMKAGSSGRYHIGFKAQQVEEALLDNELTTQDFAGFIKMKRVIDEDDPEGNAVYEEAGIKEGDDEYGLIYSEFIALNTYKIQKMQERIDSLEAIILEMQAEIQSLKGDDSNE